MSSLSSAIWEQTRRRPAALAVCDVGAETDLDRRQWSRRIEAVANELGDRGIEQGDLVGYVGTNHWLTWAVAVASWRIGADFWPVNYRWSPRELREAIGRLGVVPRLVVCQSSHGEVIDQVTGGVEVRSLDRENLAGRIRADGDEALRGKRSHRDGDRQGRLVMATSGTTGAPRMVGLDQCQLGAGARMFAEMTGLEAEDRVLVCAPNFHVAGFAALTTAAVRSGVPLVVVPSFDPEDVLEAIEGHGVTSTVMVPTMWRRLMEFAEENGRRLDELRFGICGGAPMSPALVDRAADLGFELLQGYGLTEAGPMVTLMPPGVVEEGPKGRRDSAGVAPDDVEVRILDDDHRPVAPGSTGEIAVRGPNVVDGYLGEAGGSDEESFVDGLLLTGDYGRVDEDGFLYVAGRRDELVITGGETVAPAEVEAVLAADQAVGEVAAFGVEDSRWGQKLVAVATRTDGGAEVPAEPGRVLERAGRRLADYKVPRELKFVDELPTTPSGKVSRRRLREVWSENWSTDH